MAPRSGLTRPTRGLAVAARDVLRFLDRRRVPACVIGGLAVQQWGEPRTTQDVGLTILAPFGEEAGPVDLHSDRMRPGSRTPGRSRSVIVC